MKIKNTRPVQLLKKYLPLSRGMSGNEADGEIKKMRSSDIPLGEGRLFKIWSWILPLFLGFVLGWLGMISLEVSLDAHNHAQRPANQVAVAATVTQESEMMNMTAFFQANPFRVTPMKVATEEPVAVSGDLYVPITGSLATAILRGTLPGVGAWLEDKGKQHLILLNTSFDVYTLKEVSYLKAVFKKGEEHVVKELLYGSLPAPIASVPAADSNAGSGAPAGQINPADPEKGTEGLISREEVNRLVENPFDELKQVRIRPSENNEGLQVQWITKDSILNKLGVKKGDVIRAINGIPFKNMTDITNSMSSLMNSDRFDVEIGRNGATTSLKYVVR